MAKILVVDDHEDLLIMMTVCLEKKGYTVRTATSKTAFFAALESFDPDLIILDVMLGPDNGRDICREIKASQLKHIPIILYSAVSTGLEDFAECNADDILEKPFDVKRLFEKINLLIVQK